MKSTTWEVPDVTGWQGLEPETQIVPTAELPPGIPLTLHANGAPELSLLLAVRVVRRVAARVVAEGEIAMLPLGKF